MNVKKIAIAAGALGLISATLAACSSASNNKAALGGNQGNRNSELKSVAVTVGDLSNPFFVLMGQGAEAEAKKLGGNNVRTTVVSSGYDLNQQFNQIENFIAASKLMNL